MKNYWFTLIELIITVTIISILGTISYLSYSTYSSNARDSIRLNEVNNISKTLELYYSVNSKYVEPTNPINITYSWGNLFSQWTFWIDSTNELKIYWKVPKDPLSKNEYSYSLINSKKEYEIWYALEKEEITFLVEKANAANKLMKWYIKWNYNWKFATTNTWWIDYIIAIPSITVMDNSTDIISIISNKKLISNGIFNTPSTYNSSDYNKEATINYVNNDPVLFSWNIRNLYSNEANLLNFAAKLKKSYLDSDFLDSELKSIDIVNKPYDSKNLVLKYINNNFWWLPTEKKTLDNTCEKTNLNTSGCFSPLDINNLVIWYDFSDNILTKLNSSNVITEIKNKWLQNNSLNLVSWNPVQWEVNWKKTLRLTNDIMTSSDSFSWSTEEFHFYYISKENSRSSNFMINFNWTNWACNWSSSSNRVSVHAPWWDWIWYMDLWWCDWNSRLEIPPSKQVWDTTIVSAFSSRIENKRWFYLDWWRNWTHVVNSSVKLYTWWWIRIWEWTSDTELLEFFAFNKKLNDSDQKKLEWYMACKWWIQSNLPDNHPYKNICPNK